jgi:hypothetical protein
MAKDSKVGPGAQNPPETSARLSLDAIRRIGRKATA